jgi:predicted nuclease of predicted toxin-antitoxin system
VRFLVDVNASGAVARWLAGEGHDVVCVSDRDPRMTDKEILNWALRDRRIIVTTDQDFEEMVWRERRAHQGILRLENVPRVERRALLRDVLVRHRDALKKGAIVIALSRKTRIRTSW